MLSLEDVLRNAKRHLSREHMVSVEPRPDGSGFRVYAMGGISSVWKHEFQAVADATMQIGRPGDEFYCEDCARWNAAVEASLIREDQARAAAEVSTS